MTTAPTTRKVPVIGARRLARDLVAENAAQARELARLREVVQRFAIEDAVERTIALEDLHAEITTQQARLNELITRARELDAQLVPDRD